MQVQIQQQSDRIGHIFKELLSMKAESNHNSQNVISNINIAREISDKFIASNFSTIHLIKLKSITTLRCAQINNFA